MSGQTPVPEREQPTPAGPGEPRPDGGSSRAVVGGRNLPVAIAVGLLLAGAFLGSLAWHPLAFTTVVAALAVVAMVEIGRVLADTGRRVDVPVLVGAVLAMLYGAYLAGSAGLLAGVVALLLGTVLRALADPRRARVAERLGLTVLFGLWVGLLAAFAPLLVDRPSGTVIVLAVVGGAILSDIGGYAFGVTLGRHKLAPVLSPNKTWEGLAGAVALPVVLAALVLPQIDEVFTPISAALLAGLASLAAMAGDLAESMLKRDLEVKDLGDVLPGHGGILDRVDGILFALPVGTLAAELLL